ncbi:MAG TPA: hypothetical protein VJH03_00660 [Blastocatellia bacterium]|nr:hypothetical protein [Blastocatellia bacterium]
MGLPQEAWAVVGSWLEEAAKRDPDRTMPRDALADYEMARAADVGFVCVVSEFTASREEHSFLRMQSVADLLGLLKSG